MIFIFYRYLRLVRRRERESDTRVITAQREQYSVIVHLFIGTRRSLDKITFVSLNFTANNKASCQGSSSLFSFRPVPPMSHPGFGAPRLGREHNHQVCWDQVSYI
jgi:hypothetical protein